MVYQNNKNISRANFARPGGEIPKNIRQITNKFQNSITKTFL